jgi:hypothetical protein
MPEGIVSKLTDAPKDTPTPRTKNADIWYLFFLDLTPILI